MHSLVLWYATCVGMEDTLKIFEIEEYLLPFLFDPPCYLKKLRMCSIDNRSKYISFLALSIRQLYWADTDTPKKTRNPTLKPWQTRIYRKPLKSDLESLSSRNGNANRSSRCFPLFLWSSTAKKKNTYSKYISEIIIPPSKFISPIKKYYCGLFCTLVTEGLFFRIIIHSTEGFIFSRKICNWRWPLSYSARFCSFF